MTPFELLEIPALQPIPAAEMLGHVRPAHARQVRLEDELEASGALVREFLISSHAYRGADLWMSLRLCIGDPASRELVFSLPGGHGVFSPALHAWLGSKFRRNYAVVDWIGRGKSPVHDEVRCEVDPMWAQGESFRDAYLFHNLSSIWAAMDWLTTEGYRISTVIGTSWGGVQAFLLAQLDPRLRHVSASFGCGGFCIPGIEKRSSWDDAIEVMGPAKSEQWFRAFDPLLRLDRLEADVTFETATNDKFFSMEMAMATWRRVPRKRLLRIEPNQDHTLEPCGAQAYWLEALHRAELSGLEMFSKSALDWAERTERLECDAAAGAEGVEMFVSSQLPARGDMSRDWRRWPSPSGASAGREQTLAFACLRSTINSVVLSASTPIQIVDEPTTVAPAGAPMSLLTSNEPLWTSPVGDRMNPVAREDHGAWRLSFSGAKWARFVRFGLRPQHLPTWRELIVRTREPIQWTGASPEVMLSHCYNRSDETAYSAPFSSAEVSRQGESWEYRFARDVFTPRTARANWFGLARSTGEQDLLDGFDAVSLADYPGGFQGDILLEAIELG